MTTLNWSPRCANTACMRAGCPGTTRARSTRDLVILRATWDYIDRLDEFLAWTTRVRNVINAPAVVAWNTDKRYLADLAAAGVPTVPSRFFAPGERVRLPKGEIVVKPAVGAGSVGAQRFTDTDEARRHVAELARPRVGPCWSSPTTSGSRTVRRRWSSSVGASRTRSPRGRSCRRPATRPSSTTPARTPKSR